jgi:hypothetical protein
MFYDLLTYIKYIFHVKIQLLLFSDCKVLPGSESAWIRIVSAMWIGIRIEVKSWIRICIETNADPQRWFLERIPPASRATKVSSAFCFLYIAVVVSGKGTWNSRRPDISLLVLTFAARVSVSVKEVVVSRRDSVTTPTWLAWPSTQMLFSPLTSPSTPIR